MLHPVTGDVYIVDVHFGSDDKLVYEDALFNHLRTAFPSSAAYASTLAYISPQEAATAIRRKTHSHLAAFTTTNFNTEGAMTPAGWSALRVSSLEDDDVQPEDIHKITSFTQARYARHYAPLVGILRRSSRAGRGNRRTSRNVHLLVIAVGVAGSMPRFTTRNISTLFPKPREARKVRLDLRHCAWRGAVSIYSAWRAEEEMSRQ